MPRVGYFDGIAIYVQFNEHDPPHFHAYYGGYKASFTFEGEFMIGEMPKRQMKQIKSWALKNYDLLVKTWYSMPRRER